MALQAEAQALQDVLGMDLTMAFFSVWDWQDGDWRVYRHDNGGGMFDPMITPSSTDKKLGVVLEDVLVEVPRGARFVGRSQLCLGRAAVDEKARKQALAKLPEGLGNAGTGAVELGPTVKTVAVAGLAFAGGLFIAWGLAQMSKKPAPATSNRCRRHNRRRRNGCHACARRGGSNVS